MTLYEMLDNTIYYGEVMICARNAFDQCIYLFNGKVEDARKDTEDVWDYLMNEVDQWICGNEVMLIYVKHYGYEERLEKFYCNSDKWTRDKRPYLFSSEVEKKLREYWVKEVEE